MSTCVSNLIPFEKLGARSLEVNFSRKGLDLK